MRCSSMTRNDAEHFKVARTSEFIGHKKKVHSVAWSCTGRKLASGSVDQTARVWVLDQTGFRNEHKSELELKGHSDSVDQVTWDPVCALPWTFADLSTDHCWREHWFHMRNEQLVSQCVTQNKGLQYFAISDGGKECPLGHSDWAVAHLQRCVVCMLVNRRTDTADMGHPGFCTMACFEFVMNTIHHKVNPKKWSCTFNNSTCTEAWGSDFCRKHQALFAALGIFCHWQVLIRCRNFQQQLSLFKWKYEQPVKHTLCMGNVQSLRFVLSYVGSRLSAGNSEIQQLG